MPEVSVIIPTYNRALFLKEAINSVLAQSFKDWELWIIDDGSQDDTKQVVCGFKDHRLHYLVTPHRGVSHARNVGIRHSQSPFIAFLDSDDLWLPNKLEIQLSQMKAKGWLICQTQEIWIRRGQRVNPKKYHQKPSGWMFAESLKRCLISPSAVMIKRRLLDEVGLFDETFPACEDYDLWLRITSRYPVYLIDKPLVIKRGGHSDQLSRTLPALDKWRIKAILKLLKNGELDPQQTALALQELINKCQIYAQGCLKRQRHFEALFYFTLPQNLSLNYFLQKG